LQIITFPCNQFLSQEPQGSAKIEACVRKTYALDAGFLVMEKVEVNGPKTHPVYQWLRLRGSEDAAPLAWNFCLFLVASDGLTVTRYAQSRSPCTLRADIEEALSVVCKGAVVEPGAPTGESALAVAGVAS